MPTTIKINDDTKERLEKIRARFMLQGRKFRQDELIDFIVKLAETYPLLLNRDEYQGPTSQELRRFFATTFKADKSSKTLDEEIYNK